MITIVQAFQAAVVAILLLAAVTDARRLIIPNIYSICLIALFIAANFLGFPFEKSLVSHLLHFLIALSVGLLLFKARWFGGGDIKLYSATALWFGLSSGIMLLLITAASGVVIVIVRALVYFLRAMFGTKTSSSRGGKRIFDRRIAYGIAIAAGGSVSMIYVYQ